MRDNATNAALEFLPTLRKIGAINLSDADAALLLRFSADVKAAAISCVVLLSWLNAAILSKPLAHPAGLSRFVPPRDLPTFYAVGHSQLAVLLTPAVVVGFKGFGHFLNASVEAVEALFLELGVAQAATASDRLDSVARFANMTLKDLIGIHKRLFREFDVAELSYLSALLDDVTQGKSPLFADGVLLPVKTDFTIRDVRVALNADALVANSNDVMRVIVRNISQGGLGFEAAGAIETGRMIIIKLTTSGRQLQGRVVWRVGQKAGVEFSERLSEGDDLFL